MKSKTFITLIFTLIGITSLLFRGSSFAQNCDGINTSYCNNLVSVTIYNSYSGNIQFAATGNQVVTGGSIWLSGNTIPFLVMSDKSAEFYLTGEGLTATSGFSVSGINNSTTGYPFSEGSNNVFIYFNLSGEHYSGNTLQWMRDITPPVQSELQGPNNNTVIQGSSMLLSWSASNETGVGFSGYVLEFSLDGTWNIPIAIILTGTSYNMNLVGLPNATYFRRVRSVDLLGNTSISIPKYFHLGAASTAGSSANGSVGGNQGSYDVLIHNPEKSINPQQTPGCSVNPSGIICLSDVVGLHATSMSSIDTKKSQIGNQMNQHLKGLDRSKVRLPGMIPKSGVDVDPEPFEKIIKEQTRITSCAKVSNIYIAIYIIVSFIIGYIVAILIDKRKRNN